MMCALVLHCYKTYLVGGLEHEHVFFSPYIGNWKQYIIPTDFHIFQRGRYTTNQIQIQMVITVWICMVFHGFVCHSCAAGIKDQIASME